MKNLAVVVIIAVMLCAGCGGDGGSDPITSPSVPTGLSAQGSLGKIELTWEASTGTGLKGYNVYRSADGTTFTMLNADPLDDLTYEDTDVDDGIYYSYSVTAVGNEESDYSSIVRQMHGTRLLASYDSGCMLESGGLNPFVAEDTITIAGGSLEVESGASLYILDSAVVDFVFETDGPNMDFDVNGLIRIAASPSAPARLTAHHADGVLDDGKGYALKFGDGTIDYNPGDGSGTLIQNCYIENLREGDGALRIYRCSPRFYNCRISSNKASGGSYFSIYTGSAPIIENCYIYRVTVTIAGDLRGTGALITKNILRGSYYTLYFAGPRGPSMIDSGQIAQNDLDGTVHGLYMFLVDEGDIPLGNNYWDGGVPSIVGGDGTPVFTPTLTEPPADCGPTW